MRIPVQLPIRKRQLLVILGVLFCLVIASVLLWPKKSALQTEREYYQQIESHIKQMDKTVLKSYQDKISQLQMFCNDYKAVADLTQEKSPHC